MRQLLILLAALFPATALAQTPMPITSAEAGNLPSGFYVQSPCIKPDKTAVGIPIFNDPSYNYKVARFNKAVIAFNVCLKSYLDNSNNDIAWIQSIVNTAVAEARGAAAPAPPAAHGNMPVDFYPRSPCVKPDQGMIGAQPSTSDHEAMVAYNLRVADFNKQTLSFSTCLKTYQDNARRDIRAIQAATQAATGQ